MPTRVFTTDAASHQIEDDEPRAAELDSPLDEDDADAAGDGTSDVLPNLTTLKIRPEATRNLTDPSPAALLQSYWGSSSRPSSSHRNRSPYSRSHLRSRSSGAALSSAPLMARAHSSPAVHSTSRAFDFSMPAPVSLTPVSPMRTPARQRSPFRVQDDGPYSAPQRSPSRFETVGGSAIESIQEDSELSIPPRQPPNQPLPAMQASFSRSSSLRRRPASPLHTVSNANASASMSFPASVIDQNAPLNMSVASSSSNSPSLAPSRFNEAYPSLHHYASSSSFSSIPSTPTSQRSRSPSVTSLETIEDDPDLETEAIESERIERLRIAAERAERAENGEDADDNPRRRSSLDVPRGFGFSRGGNREKKRWSVCGGERRADLDLETIWEDRKSVV